MNCLLGKGELVAFEAKGGIDAVTVRSGRIWLTRNGERTDYCLEAGELLSLGSAQGVVLEALEDAAVSVLWREEPARLTLTLAWTRQLPAK